MFKPKVLMVMLLLTVTAAPIYSAKADTLIWQSNVSSDGTPVTSITLDNLHNYRIEVSEIFSYQVPGYLAADAMYYTTTTPEWNWVNHYSLPDGHSFLQINGDDVDWGPFSNGDTGHKYNIIYVGDGDPIVFRIKDWMDNNNGNNYCHLVVKIYEEPLAGRTPGFWKHNISVLLGLSDGSFSSFFEGGPHLTAGELEGYLAAAGFSAEDALAALTSRGPGSESKRADCANALNAAAGFGPFV